jgi:hypothetical protein
MDITCEVVGPEGSALLAGAQGAPGITVVSSASGVVYPADCRERFRDAYQTQIDDFGAACRGAETANATLEDDRWAVATAVAARSSAVRGQPLAVGPDWDWA